MALTEASLEKRRRAVELRMDGLTLKQVGKAMGLTPERVRQLLKGTEVDGVYQVEVALRQQEREAEREAAKARREAKKHETCRTCGDLLRARPGYANGECHVCRTYRSKLGATRPAHLHGRPPGRPRGRHARKEV